MHADSRRFTVPLKLLLVTVICVMLDTPAGMVREEGFAWIVKSGGGLAEIVILIEWERVPVVVEYVPVTVTWYEPDAEGVNLQVE